MVGGHLNLWSGFAVEPVDDDSKCARFVEHLWDVIADRDQVVFDYVANWLARRVQGIYNRKPGEPLERMISFIAMRSAQGTGKSLFERYVAAIFGPSHALITSNGEGLTKTFNWSFANLALLVAEEAFFAGDHKSHNMLKSFLTEPVFSFEQKFRDPISLPNHVAVLMSTNKAWAVPADVGDRRSCVIDVSERRKGDGAYFKALAAEMQTGGPAALMGWLLKRDIAGFDPEVIPQTTALAEQQIMTLGRDDPTLEWLHEALETGTLPHSVRYEASSDASVPVEWPATDEAVLVRRDVGEHIREFAGKTRKFAPPSNDAIGRTLRKSVGARGKYDRPSTKVERLLVWRLPPLPVARERFKHYLRTGSLPDEGW